MTYRSFEDLDVWKRSCQFAVTIYRLAKDWQDYGLRDQMQRAAVSVASNIAEGCERGGKDFSRFLRISLGSAAELRTQIYIAKKVGLIQSEEYRAIVDESKEISKMLMGLTKSIGKKES